MKKLILSFAFLASAMIANAVPAQPGLWRTLHLKGGSTVTAQLVGDEHLHYWVDKQSNKYIEDGNQFVQLTAERLEAMKDATAKEINQLSGQVANSKSTRPASRKKAASYIGPKKGLILLVQFSDKSFSMSDPVAYYNRVANEENFTDYGFVGSVHDYFYQQSNGQFDLTFDIVGPYTLGTVASYGGNDSNGDDTNPQGMVAAAVSNANSAGIDFSQYDWDGDGTVEEVYIIYAGRGEATGGDASTIWPHKSAITPVTTHDGYNVSTYACSNELRTDEMYEGIGTICHEFSHCLGFPDMYDILHNGTATSTYGMGSWDLMNSGSHNGNGYYPASYTAYEKMVAGWITPVELTNNTSVSGLETILNGGNAYIFYNPADSNEYYMVENRQQTGFDQALPGAGLMIYHIDYDPTVWANNMPNTIYSGYNDHERITFFAADNQRTTTTESNDAWPYGNTNSFSNQSSPAATVFNKNTDSTLFMNIALSDIAVTDGLGSFSFVNYNITNSSEGYAFKETFDKCAGKGGNGSEGFNASNTFALRGWGATFTPDNGTRTDWTGYSAAYGANQCMRLGGGQDSNVSITTPEFSLNGEATLTFKASPLGIGGTYDGTGLTVTVNGNGSLGQTSFTMKAGEWTSFSTTIKGEGTISLTFQPEGRFFLDEIEVPNPTTGITDIHVTNANSEKIYRLDGIYMGTDTGNLPAGIYIRNGKKFVVK